MRWKLAAAMGVPSLALSLLVVYEISDLASDVEAVRQESELATSADGPTGLFIGLQDERNWAAADLLGQSSVVPAEVRGFDETRAATDEALEGFEEELADSPDEVVSAYGPATENLRAGLESLRARIDSYDGVRSLEATAFTNEIFSGYKELIDPFLEGTSAVVDAIGHANLGRGAALIDTSLRLIEALADMTRSSMLHAVLSEDGLNTAEEIGEVAAQRDQYERFATRLMSESTGIYAPAVDEWLFDEWTPGVVEHIDTAIRTGTLDIAGFFGTLTEAQDRSSYIDYRNRVASILREEAERLNDDAASRRQTYLIVVAVVWIVALAGMWIVGHMIITALHGLTRQAADVAHRRLPTAVGSVRDAPAGEDVAVPDIEPVEVGSRDEVGDVAAALNTVQQSALNLAVGQAVMRRNIADSLVNLGRRNQNLLSRQISFITELERNETDPDNLANLFHLDHLATRMRRNAESLLVLGGIQAPRPQGSSGPVRIGDVIRAALGEVQDYQRVVAPMVEPVWLSGHAVADLVHLLAELIDNALRYSPPHEKVEIRGLGHHAGYTLTVIDQGMGMHPEELARANRRLAGSEPFTVAPSKYLGHYVAGHLAARHGIQVRLQGTPIGGVTATVHIPVGILVAERAAAPSPI